MDRIFPKGIIAFAPKPGEPDFKLCTLAVTIDDLVDWLSTDGEPHLSEYRGKSQIKLQITRTKAGGVSVFVDTYKKDQQQQQNTNTDGAAPDGDLPW